MGFGIMFESAWRVEGKWVYASSESNQVSVWATAQQVRAHE